MAKIEPFEKFSERYDAWFDRHRDAYQAELAAIRHCMPSPPAKSLEVGVGSGKFAVPLGIHIGVEPSEQMAHKAEQQGIHVLRNVAEDLPFPDAEFDVVLMVTTICFVDDILKAFQEAFRVVKPQGCLIVGFVDRESALGQQYQATSAASVFYREATFYSAQDVAAYLTRAGFAAITFVQTLIPGAPEGTLLNGCGRGAFVVAKGVKTSARTKVPYNDI